MPPPPPKSSSVMQPVAVKSTDATLAQAKPPATQTGAAGSKDNRSPVEPKAALPKARPPLPVGTHLPGATAKTPQLPPPPPPPAKASKPVAKKEEKGAKVQQLREEVKSVPDLGALLLAAGRFSNKPKFIVSACDGMGGIFVAAEYLLWDACVTVAIEKDDVLCKAMKGNVPNIIHMKDLTKVSLQDILEWRPHGTDWELWFAGGPPCQPFSHLVKQKLWEDPNSEPLKAFAALKDALASWCSNEGIDFRWLMEKVASMPAQVVDEISGLLGCSPVFLDAGDFGWVLRPRLWWIGDINMQHVTAASKRLPFVELHAKGTLLPHAHVLRWNGPFLPSNMQFDNGAQWTERGQCGCVGLQVPGSSWQCAFPAGRFLCFTTAFANHPADRGDANDQLPCNPSRISIRSIRSPNSN